MGLKKTLITIALIFTSLLLVTSQELTNNIYFKPGKVTIDKSSYSELYDIADIMLALPDYEFLIAGHVDSASSRESGIKISKMRADAVFDFLVNKADVKPEQLESVGYGFTKPKFNNQSTKGRKGNRRVEISLKGSEEATEEEKVITDVDANFDIAAIAKEYNIPLKLLIEWNEIEGLLSFLEGENDQLNKNIHFRSGSSVIRSSSKKLLDKIVTFMLKYPETSFTIGGHTDSLGSLEYNKQVSQGRADAVKEYFIKSGINGKRFNIIAYGFTRPKFLNKQTWGKSQLNRRVDVVFNALNDYNIDKNKRIEEGQTNLAELGKAKNNLTIPGKKKVYHTVLKKETLFSISQTYDVKITNLRKWNKIKGNTIYTKQKLVVFVNK